MTEADRQRIGKAVIRTERQPLGNPLDDGTDFFVAPGSTIAEVRCTGEAICNVTNLSGSGSGSGSGPGGGPCNNRLWPAIFLNWDSANRCFIDAEACWIWDLNDAELSTGVRYAVVILESGFHPHCGGSGSDSGDSGSGVTHEARTLCTVMSGSSCGPGIIRSNIVDICFFPRAAGSGSGSESGIPTG